MLRSLALVLTVLSSTGVYAQAASDDPDPQTEPVILVATEALSDPVYARSVLVAKPIGGHMHVGVILNKQTDKTLSSLFPEHPPSKEVRENVFFGGPMSHTSVTALTHLAQPVGDGVLALSKDLYFVMHVNKIDALIEKTPNDARYFIGNVIWKPGELDDELERGLWDVIPLSSDLALRKDIGGMWTELHDTSGLVHASLDARHATALQRGALRPAHARWSASRTPSLLKVSTTGS